MNLTLLVSIVKVQGNIHNTPSEISTSMTILRSSSIRSRSTRLATSSIRRKSKVSNVSPDKGYLVFLFVFDSNLFSPILRPSDVPGVDVETVEL